jgi:L-alanine-DL-glutamate epimerase-like enolase superfamily enzyme
MRITHADCQLLHVPLTRPRASKSEAAAGKLNHVVVLLVQLDTDSDLRGLGVALLLQSSGKALLALAQDDLAPLLTGEDPLDHERLQAKVYWRFQSIGWRGLVASAYSAFDLALWDLKGKAANLPLHKLLGGARESAPVYGSDTAFLWMSPEQILEASRPYLAQGMMGIKVKVGGDPEDDADRLTRLREMLGEHVWLGVDANQRYDYGTALAMGHFFEEEIGCDWFEEPILCEDVEGHRRLASKLELPLALGETLFGRAEFEAYLAADAVGVLQPDLTRLGGITPFLEIAALARQHYKTVAPHLLPEIVVQLACGLPQVTTVEYMPWLTPLFANPPAVRDGRLVPPDGPGLGLVLDEEMVQRTRAG